MSLHQKIQRLLTSKYIEDMKLRELWLLKHMSRPFPLHHQHIAELYNWTSMHHSGKFRKSEIEQQSSEYTKKYNIELRENRKKMIKIFDKMQPESKNENEYTKEILIKTYISYYRLKFPNKDNSDFYVFKNIEKMIELYNKFFEPVSIHDTLNNIKNMIDTYIRDIENENKNANDVSKIIYINYNEENVLDIAEKACQHIKNKVLKTLFGYRRKPSRRKSSKKKLKRRSY